MVRPGDESEIERVAPRPLLDQANDEAEKHLNDKQPGEDRPDDVYLVPQCPDEAAAHLGRSHGANPRSVVRSGCILAAAASIGENRQSLKDPVEAFLRAIFGTD